MNERLVLGKTIRLEFDVQQTDKYGRLLAYVFADGVFVNAGVVKAGYASASAIPPNVRPSETAFAMGNHSGGPRIVWQETFSLNGCSCVVTI